MQKTYRSALRHTLIAVLTSLFCSVECITIVYNFRLAEITRPSDLELPEDKAHWIGAVTPFDRYAKNAQGGHNNTAGALGTLLYHKNHVYARIDTAVANIIDRQTKNDPYPSNRTQTDDIIFTFGKGWVPQPRFRITASGLVGFPTHKDVGLFRDQFGTGHFGLGVQLDTAYNYSPKKHHSFLASARYVRFMPANACLKAPTFSQKFRVGLGNLVDLYFANYSNYGKHQFELSYNPTFFFGATFCPFNADLERAFHFIRSSFTIDYQYGFLIGSHPSATIFVFSYSFDHGSRITRSTCILTGAFSFVFTF